MRIAALLTCHNRRESTVECVALLRAQRRAGPLERLDVVVVDAGSTDGTPDALEGRWPDITVVRAEPTLFWNGGMRRAWEQARRSGPYDAYLWVNDDTLLDDDALAVMLGTRIRVGHEDDHPAVIVGSTRDPRDGRLTYGGVHRPSPLRRLHFELLHPGSDVRRAETMNGNVVLVPEEVVARVGLLDDRFTHGMGDYDFGLRAGAAGCSIWMAPGTVGTCARNEAPEPATSVRESLKRLRGPKGLPFEEWSLLARRWAGPLWPVYAVSPYVRRMAAAARRR
jgi:GT2 family glycosyltransferase